MSTAEAIAMNVGKYDEATGGGYSLPNAAILKATIKTILAKRDTRRGI